MNGLITKKQVIDVLKETGIIIDNDLGHLVVDEINRIPAAYNVDKVVQQIKELREYCNNTNCGACKYKDSCFDAELEKIVKAGEVLKACQRVGVQVDKDELLKALKYDRNQYDKGYQDGLNADKWIPCSEREPNEDELNEAYCRNIYGSEFNVMIEGATKPTTLKYTRNGLWIDENSKIYDVIAWQPLPAPYKKEGA